MMHVSRLFPVPPFVVFVGLAAGCASPPPSRPPSSTTSPTMIESSSGAPSLLPVAPFTAPAESPCPVHGKPLQAQTVAVQYGYHGVEMDGRYRRAEAEAFPFANTHVWGGCDYD